MVSNIFYVHPIFREDSHFDSHFADGLKPPTSSLKCLELRFWILNMGKMFTNGLVEIMLLFTWSLFFFVIMIVEILTSITRNQLVHPVKLWFGGLMLGYCRSRKLSKQKFLTPKFEESFPIHWCFPINVIICFSILLMEEILHQLIGSLSMFISLFSRFCTSQVVQDFFHQQSWHYGSTQWNNIATSGHGLITVHHTIWVLSTTTTGCSGQILFVFSTQIYTKVQ